MKMIYLGISIPLFIIGSVLVIYSIFGEGYMPGLDQMSQYCEKSSTSILFWECKNENQNNHVTTLVVELLIGISMIITGVFLAAKTTSKPTQQKPEESNKELKGKTLEEYKEYYLARKETADARMETADADERLFLEIQKKLNKLMLKKGYSLSEAVRVVAEDYNKLGIYLTVDRSGTAFKISGVFSENSTVQKPVERKESESNFCENCGNTLNPKAKFCGSCGTKV